ncbi:ion transporter [Gelidibacter pelagius]|uniref:ion transporter n=1 Tax=Gelidibacter pelagius TaxID=2819985 RepID=UPI00293D4417|nr:ion transporter [Gelidibacter pelagius]
MKNTSKTLLVALIIVTNVSFSILIQVLILISVVKFSMETIPDLEPQTKGLLRHVEIFTGIILTLEYVLRIYVEDRKLNFFQFLWIIDF